VWKKFVGCNSCTHLIGLCHVQLKQDVKKQSRVKRKELNKLLGYTVRHLKDKVWRVAGVVFTNVMMKSLWMLFKHDLFYRLTITFISISLQCHSTDDNVSPSSGLEFCCR